MVDLLRQTTSSKPGFDVTSLDLLRATAHELQAQLTAGTLTNRELVKLFFNQIEKNDAYLHAVLKLCPEAYRRADLLDKERRAGSVMGPLHGIPILLKDNIATHASLGMNTTGGSLALVGSRPRKNAEIVDQILDAGLIILGKSHLSELSGFKGTKIFPGWSAAGGQTQSAYTVGNVDLNDGNLGHSSPSGSSTGSAVAVSAGYCPIAIGTDTFGSLITPSTRAALYSLRPTMDLVSRKGIIPVSEIFDTAGPMAKSVTDLANMMDVLVKPGHRTHSFLDVLPGTFENINVGVLRPEDWFFDASMQRQVPEASAQIIANTYDAYSRIKAHAKSLQEVSLISVDDLVIDGTHSFFELPSAGLKENLEGYLKSLDNTSIQTLADLIQFNRDHAEVELPPLYNDQDQLVQAQNNNSSDSQRTKLFHHARRVSRDLGIDKTLKDY